MSTATDTLGEVQGLAKAIGLLDASGEIQSDWLSRPGHYLSSVLVDQARARLVI
jgi:hypothetical protein